MTKTAITNIGLSELERGDMARLSVRHNTGDDRKVTVQVGRVRQFAGAPELTCKSADGFKVKVYGDKRPPIVEQFGGAVPDNGRLTSVDKIVEE